MILFIVSLCFLFVQVSLGRKVEDGRQEVRSGLGWGCEKEWKERHEDAYNGH